MIKNCNNCKYCFTDQSTGATECDYQNITEEDLQKYFTNEQANCSYWEGQRKESKLLTAKQVKKMFEAIENNR